MKELLPICSRSRLFGFMDADGALVIEPMFHDVGYFDDHGLAVARLNPGSEAGMGYIYRSGRIAIPAQFHDAWAFAPCSLAAVSPGKEL